MKKNLLSLLLVCSLVTVVSAKQTASGFMSLLTDWCQTSCNSSIEGNVLTIATTYKECGGTATLATLERYEW